MVECLGDNFMVHKGTISPSEHSKGDNSQANGSFKGEKQMQMKKGASQKELWDDKKLKGDVNKMIKCLNYNQSGHLIKNYPKLIKVK